VRRLCKSFSVKGLRLCEKKLSVGIHVMINARFVFKLNCDVNILLNRHVRSVLSQTRTSLSHSCEELAATEMFYDNRHALGRDKRDVTSSYRSVLVHKHLSSSHVLVTRYTQTSLQFKNTCLLTTKLKFPFSALMFRFLTFVVLSICFKLGYRY
jgi:hypothetical protein